MPRVLWHAHAQRCTKLGDERDKRLKVVERMHTELHAESSISSCGVQLRQRQIRTACTQIFFPGHDAMGK
jgi:hypothetical protein